jgi:hypothetical protein
LAKPPAEPYEFSGEGYHEYDKPYDVYEKALEKIQAKAPKPFGDVVIIDMNDTQFRGEIERAVQVRNDVALVLAEAENDKDIADGLAEFGHSAKHQLIQQAMNDKSTKAIDTYIDNLHEARFVRHVSSNPREEGGASPKAIAEEWRRAPEPVPVSGRTSSTPSSAKPLPKITRQDVVRLDKNAWVLGNRVKKKNKALGEELQRWSSHLSDLSRQEQFNENQAILVSRNLRSIINANRDELEPYIRELNFD